MSFSKVGSFSASLYSAVAASIASAAARPKALLMRYCCVLLLSSWLLPSSCMLILVSLASYNNSCCLASFARAGCDSAAMMPSRWSRGHASPRCLCEAFPSPSFDVTSSTFSLSIIRSVKFKSICSLILAEPPAPSGSCRPGCFLPN